MTQCVDGFKHVCNSLFRCFDLEIYKQSGGLGDPELLARETVCMLSASMHTFFVSVIMISSVGALSVY